jgi:hypothetical protein
MSAAPHALPALRLLGVAAWIDGLPGWDAVRAFARGEAGLVEGAPRKPAPALLAPNERRRAPDSVALALEVAMAACTDAGRDPAALPSVFASTHGDLAITDAMCRTLAEAPLEVSPTRFHNSVHNAAAGYWTIGAGCHAAATAISAYDATLAQGLLEAATLLASGEDAVLLVAFDVASTGPLGAVSASTGLLGAAFVLGRDGGGEDARAPRLRLALVDGEAAPDASPLQAHIGGNAMAPALPLLSALARGGALARLAAGGGRVLEVAIEAAEGATHG